MARTVHVIAMAALLVLAGCSGLTPDLGTDADDAQNVGRMNFYVSDQENAIDEFEHANVTVDAVAFKKADSDANDGDDSDDDSDLSLAAKRNSSAWVVRDVDERTVDLTRLQGQNAAKLVDFDMAGDTYDEVVVHVSDLQAVKKSGGTANVTVEDGTLEVDKDVDVEGGSVANYVFDMTIVETSGSEYDLEPVENESGSDVEVTEVADLDEADDDDSDDDTDANDADSNDGTDSDSSDADNDGDAADNDDSDGDDDSDSGLSASFTSDVKPGQRATVKVTDASGSPVQGATVVVNDEMVGATAADGTISFQVPQNAEELEIEIEGENDAEVDMEAGIDEVDAGDTDEDHEDDSDDSDGYESDDGTDDIESNDADADDSDDGTDSDADDGTDGDSDGGADGDDSTDGADADGNATDDDDATDGSDTADGSDSNDGTADGSDTNDGSSGDSTADGTTSDGSGDDSSADSGVDDNTTDDGSGDDSPDETTTVETT